MFVIEIVLIKDCCVIRVTVMMSLIRCPLSTGLVGMHWNIYFKIAINWFRRSLNILCVSEIGYMIYSNYENCRISIVAQVIKLFWIKKLVLMLDPSCHLVFRYVIDACVVPAAILMFLLLFPPGFFRSKYKMLYIGMARS